MDTTLRCVRQGPSRLIYVVSVKSEDSSVKEKVLSTFYRCKN